MALDQIDRLSAAQEAAIVRDLRAFLAELIGGINVDILASSIDDIDANHIRAQLALILDLDDEGSPRTFTGFLDSTGPRLASFTEAIAAHAATQAKHTINSGDPAIRQARSDATAFIRTYIADTALAFSAAIENAIYGAGTPQARARQLKRSFGLTVKQATALETMRAALGEYLAVPRQFIPARTDAAGVRMPARYVRLANSRAILANTRGHLSAAQRRMLAKALTNPKLTEAQAEDFLDAHATALRDFRARAALGEGTHKLTEEARLAGWRIAQRAGALPTTQRRYWRTAGEERVRHSHRQVPSMNPRSVSLDQRFATPLGDYMIPPLEFGCRCKTVLGGRR